MADERELRAPDYPVNLRVQGKSVLVVGAGQVASRKIGGLLASGAQVTAVGPDVSPATGALAAQSERGELDHGSLSVEQRTYRSGEVAGYTLVIACTDDAEVNAAVHDDAVAAGVWVNSADDPPNCEFTLSSIVRQGDLQLTISTAGRSPALSMWLRRRFQAEFDETWSDLLDVLAEVRAEAREVLGTSEIDGWMEALDAGLHDLVVAGELDRARDLVREQLGLLASARAAS